MSLRPSRPSSTPEVHPVVCGYDALFEPELERKYTCPVCLAGLRDPVQTKCGHRFCKSCLKRSRGNMRFAKCPVDNTWYDTAKEVFADNAVKREVLSLTVRCPQNTEECEWRGELRSLEKHDSSCLEKEVECTNGCNRHMKRRLVCEHLVTCPQRLECCSHCGHRLPAVDLPKHQLLVCEKFPVSCSICGETNILREDIPRHVDLLNGDCPLVTVKCSFHHVGCYFQDKRKNMASHYENANHQHMVLMCARMSLHEERLRQHERHLVEGMAKSTQLCEMIHTQERTLQEQQQLLTDQVERLREMTGTSVSGRLMWKLNLPDDNSCRITSPCFYTGVPGYKVRLSLELAEHRQDNKLYASIFMCLEKGNYDDSLKFPFDGTCYITLFDQSESVEERQNYQTEIVCSQVPRCESHAGSQHSRRGRLKFMLTEDLLQGRFVRRGCIVMQAEVTHFMPSDTNSLENSQQSPY